MATDKAKKVEKSDVPSRSGPAEWVTVAQAAGGTGVFKLDLTSSEWEWSPQTAVLFGYDPAIPRPRLADWASAVFPDDFRKIEAAVETARSTGVLNVEFRVQRSDGMLWLAAIGQVAGGDAAASRWIYGSLRDIGDRKALEARLLALNETLEARVEERTRELRIQSEQLRESENRFRMLVEAVTDYAIFMLDPDGKIVNWNPGAERIKGYSAAEIVGQHISRFYTEADRVAGVPGRLLTLAGRTGRAEAEGWRVRNDGSVFWASVVIDAIRSPEGALLGFAKITRDLTEKRENEEQLRQAQKMEAIGQLTGGVAHDFNNLLTVIMGNIDSMLLRLPSDGDERLRRSANAAMNATTKAAGLVLQLLAFARRQTLQPKSLSVNALITGLSDILRRTLDESIGIEILMGGGLWSTFADGNQLESALLNLAINARDAMPDGGRLTLAAANVAFDEAAARKADMAAGEYVCVSVGDTGTGMTPEVMAKAFDPFFTTKEIGKGTGLGLSQVYGFVRQSGGYVKLESEIGRGTTIKLFLPRLQEGAGAEASAPHAAGAARPRGETILVVEDNVEVRAFSAQMLRDLGYKVLEAADGHAALRLLDSHDDIALLFTDVGLPKSMNGRQLADEAQRRRPELKVLFTSGYARDAIVHQGRLDPGVDLIAKPFTAGGLEAKIRSVLDAA